MKKYIIYLILGCIFTFHVNSADQHSHETIIPQVGKDFSLSAIQTAKDGKVFEFSGKLYGFWGEKNVVAAGEVKEITPEGTIHYRVNHLYPITFYPLSPADQHRHETINPQPGKDFSLSDIQTAKDGKVFEFSGKRYGFWGEKNVVAAGEVKEITPEGTIHYRVNHLYPIVFHPLPPIAQLYNYFVTFQKQDNDISQGDINTFKKAFVEFDDPDFPWEEIKVELPEKEIERIYDTYGVLQLRPFDKQADEIMVACGNMPVTGDGHQLFTRKELHDPNSYGSRYRQIHAHKGLITINVELGKNPTFVALFGNYLPSKKPLSQLLPNNHYKTIYFEGWFPDDDNEIKGVLEECMHLLKVGGKVKLYNQKSAYKENNEKNLPCAYTFWTKKQGDIIETALAETKRNKAIEEELSNYIKQYRGQDHLPPEAEKQIKEVHATLEYSNIDK